MRTVKLLMTMSLLTVCTSCAGWQTSTAEAKVKKPQHTAIPLETKRPEALVLAKESAPQRVAAQQVLAQAQVALQRQDYARALQLLQEVVTIDGANGEAYFYLAKTYLALHQPERVEGLLERADMLLGDDPAWAERIGALKSQSQKGVI